MLFERIYEEGLAQASYFIGCQREGKAIVVDPRRDIQVYLDLAAKNGMDITAVTETHIHADYLSGTRELAAATGAEIFLSAEGGPDWQYAFEGTDLRHDDTIQLGKITVTAKHTPGHTPEHLSFLITDGAVSSDPGYLLSGDFVFVGDLGRPDLLDEAAGGVDTRFAGAKDLFRSLREVFLTLPDYVQVHPAHGAGSPCGKALGAVPSTTVGYERAHAWWSRHLLNNDEAGFVAELLDGQPDAHAYFARMKRENRVGPAVLGPLAPLEALSATEVQAKLDADAAIFIDTRDRDSVLEGTVDGALVVPAGNSASNFGAWVIDPEKEKRPLIALAPSEDAAESFRASLHRVGIDSLCCYAESLDGLRSFVPPTISVDELDSTDRDALVDIRAKSEYADGTIPGAQHLSGGSAMWRLDELPHDPATGKPGAIITFCQSGARNVVVSSALRRAGFTVTELKGSYAAWAAAS
ncbi:MBL fold metallo-hydrolase [Falsarthrobacter nasiphocae]|uniref:Hydroxyacylglutathione hydrolase n=1 Tax=Falsarthrobacter nasiphocae TaxID=189863 RepID=A0AAE4C5B5_9MICC|nr:MBL fold metallo-hydrolase [Falsarthrobacter nasiphocae]MDR6892176.1 hydroxyacylglutathione hydrolase [Falsarthrobacter nasiphocae]